jgi:hypothetical protein
MVLKTFSNLGITTQTVLMGLAVVSVVVMDAFQAVIEKAPAVFTAVDLLTGAVLTLQLYVIKRVGDHEKHVAPQLATMCERLSHMPTKEEMITSLQETRHGMRNEVQVIAGELEEKIAIVDDRITNLQEGM